MKIDFQNDEANKTKIFKISGELDVHHVKNLKAEVMEALAGRDWTYQLDMDQVTYLDSSGLGMLVYLKKEVIKKESKLKIINLHEPVLNVFKLTKLDDFFDLS